MSTPAYQTIIVKFREAITELDGIFRDTQFWGVATIFKSIPSMVMQYLAFKKNLRNHQSNLSNLNLSR